MTKPKKGNKAHNSVEVTPEHRKIVERLPRLTRDVAKHIRGNGVKDSVDPTGPEATDELITGETAVKYSEDDMFIVVEVAEKYGEDAKLKC